MKKINNKRVAKFFKQLLVNKLELMNSKKALQGSTMTEILNAEIHKPKLRHSVLKLRKCIFYESTDHERDIGKITMILRMMPEFRKFIKFNNIDHDSVRLASNSLEYKKVPKGTYIFKQGEVSKFFYGIIHGRVSIRVEEKKYKIFNSLAKSHSEFKQIFRSSEKEVNPAVTEIFEREKLILNSGEYFGEWGLIEGATRTASAFTLEDTDLFIIDYEAFIHSFGKCMIKAEIDRKSFLLSTIEPFQSLARNKFNAYYKNMIVHCLTKHETVYLEGKPADMFYVIFDGVFRLQKKNLNHEEHEDFLKSEVTKHITLLQIGRGDFAGDEALPYSCNEASDYASGENVYNLTNQNKSASEELDQRIHSTGSAALDLPKYKYSLVAENEFNIIIGINPTIFPVELRKKILNYMKPILEKKQKILNDIVKDHTKIKNKMKITYREETIKQLSKNPKNYYQKLIDNRVTIIRDNLKTEHNKQIRFGENGDLKFKVINTREDHSCSNSQPKVSKSPTNLYTYKPRLSVCQTETKPLSCYYNTDNPNGVTLTETSASKTTPRPSHVLKALIERKITIISDSELHKMMNANANSNNPVFVNTETANKFLRREKTICQTGKTKTPPLEKTKNIKELLLMNKYITNSADSWKKTKNRINSGNYDLPLVSMMGRK